MPMPTPGAWPPPHLAPAYNAYRDWDAWLVGDADQLARTYQGRDASGQSLPPSQRTRATQYSGGVVGAISRWLWGAPSPTTTRDSRLHVPLAADLAATAAGLLFSESPTLTAAEKSTSKDGDGKSTASKGVQDRLDQLVDDGLMTALRHAAEADSALGDVYLRPVVDQDVSPDAALVTTVHADGAIPVIRWGRLLEVTFWSELGRDGNTVYRLLEHHDVVNTVGRITYALHKGTVTELGNRVPFEAHDDARHLTDPAMAIDTDGMQTTGLNRLDVVRIPNAGPQRRWRKTGSLKYLGRSDFDGNEPVFDRIDTVWTSWMRDIHLGRGRLTVPAYMLENLGPGQGAHFDADREVYSAVNAVPATTGTGLGITNSQFEIRHEEHKATLDALVETAMRHAGLSSQTLGEEGDVAMTATEAQSRERMSFVTRGDRVNTWGPAIATYLELHLELEKAHGLSDVEPERPHVEFGDSVSESPETVAKTVQLLRAAEVISIETGVKMVHPDWEDKEVEAEVKRITDERNAAGPGAIDPAEAGNTFAKANLPADKPGETNPQE